MAELTLLLPLLLLLIATVIDLRTREIPDSISIGLIGIGAVAASWGWLGIRWWMVISGAALGLVIGYGMFRIAKFGGGDAKLMIGIGAVLGPVALPFFFLWMALAGGVLALIAMLRGQRDYAYGPAILLGYVGYLIFPADMWSTVQQMF